MKEVGKSSSNQPTSNTMTLGKPLVSRKLFSPKKEAAGEKAPKNPVDDEDMLTDEFDSDGGWSLNINCNVVSVLPREYYQETEVEEPEEADEIKMMKHKHVCYYVLNNRAVEEHNALFERLDQRMKNHLKPLYIIERVEQT